MFGSRKKNREYFKTPDKIQKNMENRENPKNHGYTKQKSDKKNPKSQKFGKNPRIVEISQIPVKSQKS